MSTGNMTSNDLAPRDPSPRNAARLALVMIGFVMVAIVAHFVVAPMMAGQIVGDAKTAATEQPNSFVFAAVGMAFLCFALLSQIPALRAVTKADQGKNGVDPLGKAEPEANPIGALMLSMMVRFAGTFVILGILWGLQIVSRNESVVDVLFWYVTLTTIEVVGIVMCAKSYVTNVIARHEPPAAPT